MELRDSGRDLVQINDDGTHAILPVTSRTSVQPDHARVPVMWLRRSDGKLRRDGSRAALLQPDHAVDERGRLHGASGLGGWTWIDWAVRPQAWRIAQKRKSG
jgi:hypothetical protein